MDPRCNIELPTLIMKSGTARIQHCRRHEIMRYIRAGSTRVAMQPVVVSVKKTNARLFRDAAMRLRARCDGKSVELHA